MNLTPHMREILRTVLLETRRLEAIGDRPPPGTDRQQWNDLRRERREYEQFGVPHDLARWLGHSPSPSDSAVFSRALRTMEALCLLARVSRWGGTRTTHVQLTKSGRAVAEQLAKEQEKLLETLMEGLTIQWPLDPSDDTQPGA